MATALFEIGTTIAALGGLARSAVILWGAARTFARRDAMVRGSFGPAELLAYPEPVVLLGTVAWLLRGRMGSAPPTAAAAGLAVAGALLVVLAWALVVWTWRSWPQLHVGHAIFAGQGLVTTGAYGLVRHPVYLAAVVLWAGLAIAFASAVTATIAVAYVLPAYVLYARAEERMMAAEFGERYRAYRARVPMLVPRRVGLREDGTTS